MILTMQTYGLQPAFPSPLSPKFPIYQLQRNVCKFSRKETVTCRAALTVENTGTKWGFSLPFNSKNQQLEDAVFDPLGLNKETHGDIQSVWEYFVAMFMQAMENSLSLKQERSSSTRGLTASIEDSSIDVGDFFKGPLPGKFLKLLGYLALSRVGTYIPLGGVNREAFLGNLDQNSLLSTLDSFSGGGIGRLGICSLGIVPFINAQIVFQLLGQIIPKLQELQRKEGEAGRKKVLQWTRYASVGFALVQAIGQVLYIRPYVNDFNTEWVLSSVTLLTLGAIVTTYIGEKISELKLGNGTSLLIFTSILSYLPSSFGNLLHALEGISRRLSHLESTTRHLETSLGEMKMTVENNHGATDGRLRLLENHTKEVQAGVQILRDKQEIAEAHSQLMKLQLSKSNNSISQAKPMDTQQNVVPTNPPASSVPSPPEQMFSVSSSLPPQQTIPSMQTSVTAGSQYPNSSTQIVPNELSFQPPVQQSAPAPHPYQASSNFQQVPPPSVPSLPYSQQSQPLHSSGQPVPPSVPSLPYSQQSQPQHSSGQSVPPSVPPPYGQSERSPHMSVHSVPPPHGTPLPSNRYGQEPSYMPTNYGGPNPYQQPPQAPLPPQSSQHFPGGQQMYEPPLVRTASGRSSTPMSYGPSPTGLNNNDLQSHSRPIYRVPQPVPSAPSGGAGYSQLPTAQPVQHSLPVASSITGSSSNSSAHGNQVGVDEVIDNVSKMGYSRAQVTATVQRLMEKGQQIDVNVVLDKLNDGAIQPQKDWFTR